MNIPIAGQNYRANFLKYLWEQYIFYRDEKGYEIEFRKHDVSAFARDIWSFDLSTGKHRKLTNFKGGDHDPFCVGNVIYYLSEDKTGHFNLPEESIRKSPFVA